MLVKKISDSDYTEVAVMTHDLLRSKLGYTARIINIWDLLKISLGIEEFEVLTPKMYYNSLFESYLIELQVKWMRGEEIDFEEVYNSILEFGDFTASEKRLMKDKKIEEVLWGIFLAISCPELLNNNNTRND